ncbi:transposable element Tc1 transposase [Trichonephila clavipes]|nr:transposable element Tc1 transposase [Trichonephila clavipes]
MDWPAFSPDLNPIEHVWDTLGRCIAARLHHPENTQQLKQMLIEEWALLPQEMLHQLVLSMRRRCEATIAYQRIHVRKANAKSPAKGRCCRRQIHQSITVLTQKFVTGTIVGIRRYLSPSSYKVVANLGFCANKMQYQMKFVQKSKWISIFRLEIAETLAASPSTNINILIDDEDNSVVIPPTRKSKYYNPPAIHVMFFYIGMARIRDIACIVPLMY